MTTTEIYGEILEERAMEEYEEFAPDIDLTSKIDYSPTYLEPILYVYSTSLGNLIKMVRDETNAELIFKQTRCL